ncbi:MAG: response regulator, partial [Spirochaetaceae bacterium]
MNSKILILDTSTVMLSPWKKVVAKNYIIEEAVGGVEALRKIKNDSVDLVIVNISQKSVNGVEAIGKIRGVHEKLPIIVLFDKKDALDLKQSKAYGINSMVMLPVDVRKLLVEIGRFIGRETEHSVHKPVKQQDNPAPKKESFDFQFRGGDQAGDNTQPVEEITDVEKAFYDGLSAISSNELQEAISIFQAILKVTRLKRETWRRYLEDALFQLGQCYATLGNLDRSNAYYSAFIQKAPHNTSHKSALWYMGKNYYAMKNYPKAAAYLKQVMETKPFDS